MEHTTYERAMALGAAQYRDVLDALATAGLSAEFIQTGGMCAAIEVLLDGGHYLLLTDLEDTLPWDRQDHTGWCVGIYAPEDCRTSDGASRQLEDSDGSPNKAVELAQRLLCTESTD